MVGVQSMAHALPQVPGRLVLASHTQPGQRPEEAMGSIRCSPEYDSAAKFGLVGGPQGPQHHLTMESACRMRADCRNQAGLGRSRNRSSSQDSDVDDVFQDTALPSLALI